MDRPHEPAALQTLGSEVEQQGPGQPAGLEVVEHLGLLRTGDVTECFELYDDLTIADQVCPVAGNQLPLLELNRQVDFGLKRDVAIPKFPPHSLAIHRFEKTGAQMAVDLHGRTDDGEGLGVAGVVACHSWRVTAHSGLRVSFHGGMRREKRIRRFRRLRRLCYSGPDSV
jgi:hypothetical protein